MTDLTTADFAVGDVVQHVFLGRYATVEKVGRELLSVRVHLTDTVTQWRPTSVRKVDG